MAYPDRRNFQVTGSEERANLRANLVFVLAGVSLLVLVVVNIELR